MENVTIERTKEYLVIKIPMRAVEKGKTGITKQAQTALNEAISKGLEDIRQGRTFGPFQSIREFKAALKAGAK